MSHTVALGGVFFTWSDQSRGKNLERELGSQQVAESEVQTSILNQVLSGALSAKEARQTSVQKPQAQGPQLTEKILP